MQQTDLYQHTICHGFLACAIHHPERIAVRMGETCVTYAEMARQAEQIAQFIVHKNLTDKRIGIHLPNSPQFLTCFYGIVLAKAVAVPLPFDLPEEQLADWMEHLELTEIWKDIPTIYTSLTMQDTVSLPVIQPTDLFYIAVSSGSTGKSKGILRSHDTWVESFRHMTHECNISAVDRILLPGSLHFSASLFAALHVLYEGGEVVLHTRFHVNAVLDALVNEGITVTFMVPTMLAKLISRLEQEGIKSPYSLKSVTCITSGSKLADHVKEKWLQYFPNSKLFEYYGASELSFVSVLRPMEQLTIKLSVGQAFSGVEIIIRDEEGQPLPANQIGEVYIASNMIAQGYGHRGADQFLSQVENTFSVGDVGYLDEQGYLYLTGRKQEMILRGGVNVFPLEVEEALKSCPFLENVVAFGFPDEIMGEVIVAAVIPKDKNETRKITDLAQICGEWIASRLPRFKSPDIYWEIDTVPLGSTGKVDRKRLKETFANRQSGGKIDEP